MCLSIFGFQGKRTIEDAAEEMSDNADKTKKEKFSTSSRLTQYFAIVPAKLRLVTLMAFLQAECLATDGKVCKSVYIYVYVYIYMYELVV